MEIKDAPMIVEMAQLMAKQNGVNTRDVLKAIQITVLATLAEVISRKEFSRGEDY